MAGLAAKIHFMTSLHQKHLRFFVLGDWGREGKFGQKDMADTMADVANFVKPDFVVSTGDNFYDEGVTDVNDILWEISFETVYHQKSLQIPWYATLGNHDYMLNPQAQVEYTEKSRRWKMPARYYAQTFKVNYLTEALFVFLDTSPLVSDYRTPDSRVKVEDQNAEKQLQWLEETLRGSTARWKVVVGHHPLFSAGSMHGNNPELIERLKPIFDRYQVQAYFAGHEHDVQHLKPGGRTHYFVSGAGSRMRDTGRLNESVYSSSENSFLDVVLTEDFMQVRFIQTDSLVAYSAHIEADVADTPLMFIHKK